MSQEVELDYSGTTPFGDGLLTLSDGGFENFCVCCECSRLLDILFTGKPEELSASHPAGDGFYLIVEVVDETTTSVKVGLSLIAPFLPEDLTISGGWRNDTAATSGVLPMTFVGYDTGYPGITCQFFESAEFIESNPEPFVAPDIQHNPPHTFCFDPWSPDVVTVA